ncbi:MAG: T9SS type A sorting domain-containing protein [Ferruginibacter sp.]
MKKFTFGLLLSFITVLGYSQCAEITSTAVNSNGPGQFAITINYTGTPGETHISAVVFCNSSVTTSCVPVNASGTSVLNVACSTTPIVILVPSSGPCEIGFPCGAPTFVFGPVGGPLPIKMENFYAARNGSSVMMSWETQTEINSKEFVIERKTTGDFETVTVVPATNITTGSKYQFSDNNTEKVTSQYRLKMFDFDGSFRYSEIRAVKGVGSSTEFSVFPNPSNGTSRVSITDVSPSNEIQVINNSGRVVKTVSMKNQSSFELNNLPNGIYMIRVINKETGDVTTKKLSVIN